MRRHAIAATLFILLAVLMTWPLGRIMSRAVAYPGDPYINAWILDWTYYALRHQPLRLFEANAFHPAHYSLAFSENLFAVGLLMTPFRLAGAGPITAHNIALILGLALSGFGAYLLAWRLTDHFAAAMAAGCFYAFVPFRFTHLPHLQHAWAGWMPLLIWALLLYVDRPGWRRAILFASLFLVSGLTNVHWFLFGSFTAAAVALLFHWAGRRRWRELLVSVGGAALLLSPFFYPYAAVARLYGMTRSISETRFYSALPGDWLLGNAHTRFYRGLLDPAVDAERWLFPGALGMIVSLAALPLLRRHPLAVMIGLICGLLGFFGSLGLNGSFHTFLYDAVPGFQAIRAPARWAGVAYMGMAVLIAVTTTALAGRLRQMVWLVPILFLIELRAAPIRWYMSVVEPPAVYRWLAENPAAAPLLELPIGKQQEYLYMLRSTAHRLPMVNGVSGFTPPEQHRIISLWNSADIPPALVDELIRHGVRTVIIHADDLEPHGSATRRWVREEVSRGRLRFLRRFTGKLSGDWVFAVDAAGQEGAIPPALDPFLDDRPPPHDEPFGLMDPPAAVMSGAAIFSGFAFSPHGVRRVDLLFENGAVRVEAQRIADAALQQRFPGYGRAEKPRFVRYFDQRPPGVGRETDVQVEITDNRGQRLRLEPFLFLWEQPRRQ